MTVVVGWSRTLHRCLPTSFRVFVFLDCLISPLLLTEQIRFSVHGQLGFAQLEVGAEEKKEKKKESVGEPKDIVGSSFTSQWDHTETTPSQMCHDVLLLLHPPWFLSVAHQCHNQVITFPSLNTTTVHVLG
uniref:Uncharacterized protein n=1 Tax=Trypanosoma congolense (strain IL3000) TaxID=1068625 RepID=G0URB2_TRYCI|nr:hypothetical protein, unlikely [Trypanosoma congolense IL3000]